MPQDDLTEKDVSRVRMCWEQVTGRRLTTDQRELFAEKLAHHRDLAAYRSEHLRAFAYAALEGWGTENKTLRLPDWLASVEDSRARKQTPWAHAKCVTSYMARSAYKDRADFKGNCGKCGQEIRLGDRIAHSY